MSGLQLGIDLVERGYVPDVVLRAVIRRLCRSRTQLERQTGIEQSQAAFETFVAECRRSPVALVPELANEQHYEVPAEFFRLVLGNRLKYSCCYYPDGVTTLDDAEVAALRETCQRAQLADGQRLLELGCGWGSLSLWMAEYYPHSQITAVSNSATQRADIEAAARSKGFTNLQVITADMNAFAADPGTYDRVVSVEMFEHMRNHELLLERISSWLKPDGKLFVHIFCHRTMAYVFETKDDVDWMGRYFFSGGIMPSAHLLLRYPRRLQIASQWSWDGRHYYRTCNAWLAQQDAQRDQIMRLFREAYGPREAGRWFQRWRMFFIACAELFGCSDGQEWFVAHYLFEQAQPQQKSSRLAPRDESR